MLRSIMSHGRAKFTEAEIGRILKAAARVGVGVRVEILPDGRLVVTSRKSDEASNDDAANPWDGVLENDKANKKRPS